MYDPSKSDYAEYFKDLEPSCASDNGIEDGDQITISDDSGKLVARGQLRFNKEESKEDNSSVIGGAGYCIFNFDIPNINSDSELFEISIANQPNTIPAVDRDDLKNGLELSMS